MSQFRRRNSDSFEQPLSKEALDELRLELKKYEKELQIFLELEAHLKTCKFKLQPGDARRLREKLQEYVAKNVDKADLFGFVNDRKNETLKGQSLACKQPNGSVLMATREHKLGNLMKR